MKFDIDVTLEKTMTFEGIEADDYEQARQIAVERAELNPDWEQIPAFYTTPDEGHGYTDEDGEADCS